MDSEYRLIAGAIEYLTRQRLEQPTLDQLAKHSGVSTSRLQRAFSRWAGISPKRMLQYLTVQAAREKLEKGRSLFDTALDSGLSSGSRLHDHFIKLYAMSPADYRDGGANLSIRYSFHDTPFGECLLARTDHGICWLSFTEPETRNSNLDALRTEWPAANLQPDTAKTAPLAASLFPVPYPDSRLEPLFLHVKGSNFQLKVWEALLRIPEDTALSYSDLARQIGQPRAARAVGSAVGANPISWLIPCHRVIRANGIVGDYRWGRTRKQAMLAWESSRRERGRSKNVFGDP
ncbi:MAG: methylated-DNA--[protein]-cysteine S-methyltransferase [Pseudomonadota bacterium]|nr:methylated-DNA--[protein]-cysteine S-methyltransferase [Pseudomonadota bacterium]